MADTKAPAPITRELAPSIESAVLITEPYLKIMANPDGILSSKGAGDFKIYQEVMRDDTVKSTFQQRRLAVVSSEWTVDPGADDAASKAAAEALKEDLEAINWDAITDQMLFAVFYGYGVAEVMWSQRDGRIVFDGIKVRDRARFRFGIDSSLFLRQVDGSFSKMPDRKFWVVNTGADHSDNPYGLGLAHWLYWPTYFKRTDIKFWLIFLEKFGMPTAVGKAPAGQANDPNTRARILQALRSIATDSAVVLPEGAEVELLEATRSGAASYEAMKDAMDKAIAKIVLSQVMTSEAVGGQYKADVQDSVKQQVVKADADLVCESFNRGPVKWWTEYNFPGAKPPRVYRITEPKEDLQARAQRDKAIKELGYEPTEEYIRETYGEGWIKSKTPPAGGPQPFANVDPNAPDFAEAALIAALKTGQRADQVALLDAAQQFANKHQDMIGARVQQLLNYAESSDDFETFRKRLVEMMAEAPTQEMVQPIERGGMFARLLGAFRAQR
jgi:phage gp29-like protein